ncbi:1-aminocyclopropane-1-carboxylate synthase 1 [Colletotrichum chlorophyti]|uniref:1-aminocyclopropane-1-carboxylate synthase 1 n=1 Tax=Colletotrichum chlorophyti TaxID=708187 RepID=A0A1Q8S8P8_9PEZI|nr:1-aminocyclopropane-1-carboxylate synthase 1 [Colletotrichum chlorophyti]
MFASTTSSSYFRDSMSARSETISNISREFDGNVYHATKNPKGMIDMGSAINEVMLDDVESWAKRNLKKNQLKNDLGYNDTPVSPELLAAAAGFMTEHFRARLPLTPDNIVAASGVATLLDTLTSNIAGPDGAILLPTPTASTYAQETCARNGIRVVEVPCDDIPDERFWGARPRDNAPILVPEIVTRLATAIESEKSQNRAVAGVLLSNPESSTGRSYAAHILLQIYQLCASHDMHLIIDEEFAMSAGESFSSILSLGLDDFRNVHVLWSMDKDFGLDGVNIGFLATYNQQLCEAMRTESPLTYVSSCTAALSTKLLSDAKFLRKTYLPTLRRRLIKRQAMVEEGLEQYEIPYRKADAGFFVSVDLSKWADLLFQRHGKKGDLEFLAYIMKRRVFLEPGQTFSSREPGWFRLSFGGEKETFKLGLQRLFYSLRSLEGRDPEPFALAPKLFVPPPNRMAHLVHH